MLHVLAIALSGRRHVFGLKLARLDLVDTLVCDGIVLGRSVLVASGTVEEAVDVAADGFSCAVNSAKDSFGAISL